MSVEVLKALTLVLLSAAVLSLVLCIAFVIAAMVGWKGPRRGRRLKAAAVCLLLVPVCAGVQQLLFWKVYLPQRGRAAQAERDKQIEPTNRVRVRDAAPDFTVTDTRGNPFSLAEQRGKVVLVNFFATWCGPCRAELPELQKLWEQHEGNPEFTMIIIGREESNETLYAFVSENRYTFPIAPDPERSAYELYAEQYIPRTYLISREGEVVFATIGFRDEEFRSLVSELSDQLGR